MIITHLEKHPEFVPILATWTFQEWGSQCPTMTIEGLKQEFQKRVIPQRIPESFVAVEDGTPLGMASLQHDDMSTRMELSPWLAAVYVDSKFRDRGIGSLLVQKVMEEAKTLGLKKFYLFTPDKMGFYRRLGWQDLEETEYRGRHVSIMYYEF